MARIFITAGCGVVRIVATLTDVPMTPTVAVAGWDHGVVVGIAVTVVVAAGGDCDCGEDCGGEVG